MIMLCLYDYAECLIDYDDCLYDYAECLYDYAECRNLFPVILNVMLSVVILDVLLLRAVLKPKNYHFISL